MPGRQDGGEEGSGPDAGTTCGLGVQGYVAKKCALIEVLCVWAQFWAWELTLVGVLQLFCGFLGHSGIVKYSTHSVQDGAKASI